MDLMKCANEAVNLSEVTIMAVKANEKRKVKRLLKNVVWLTNAPVLNNVFTRSRVSVP